MAHKEEEEQMKATSNEKIIKTIFNTLDANQDGHITPEELVNGGNTVGIKLNISKATKMVGELDKDGNGYVQFGEFRKCMQKVLTKIHKENEIYKASFKKFDVDGNGFIDKDELQQVLSAGGKRRMSESQIDEMFSEADVDGDGQLTFNEFVNYFCRV